MTEFQDLEYFSRHNLRTENIFHDTIKKLGINFITQFKNLDFIQGRILKLRIFSRLNLKLCDIFHYTI